MYCGACGGFYSSDCPRRAEGACRPAENPFESKSLRAIILLEAEVARLEKHNQSLLECNNAYLQRARNAEAKLRELSCVD